MTLDSVAVEESKKGAKPAAVRALEVMVEGEATGGFSKPTIIASPEQLAKSIKGEAAVAAIKKSVDFEKDVVLYFAWAGSGQDKLTSSMDVDTDGFVTFTFAPGKTRDIRQHKKLFAIPQDAKIKIVP